MQFVGRENELKKFEARYGSRGAELIFLYGRRRVGKTEFLRKFAEGKTPFFFSATESNDFEQRTRFRNEMLSFGVDAEPALLSDWQEIFRNLAKLKNNEGGKTVVIIDEFQYMFVGDKAIPSVLQNQWDAYLSKANVMLILCGSAMSFVEQEVLGGKKPLYGRATAIFKMQELPFLDAIKFFPNYSSEEKIVAYSILGGVPYYLKQFSPDKSLFDNIKHNILSSETILYNEIEFLLKQEFREVATYNTIISAIALGNTKLNEISQKTMIEGAKANVYIKNLIEIGVVAKDYSLLDTVKSEANIRNGLFRIRNNFFRFWYRYVYPNKSEVERGHVDYLADAVYRSASVEHASLVFEDICLEHIAKLNYTNILPFRAKNIGKVWAKGLEVDIGAILDDNILLAECKWTNAPVDLGVLKSLKEKTETHPNLVEYGKRYYFLFSKSGYTQGLLETITTAPNVGVVALDEIFE